MVFHSLLKLQPAQCKKKHRAAFFSSVCFAKLKMDDAHTFWKQYHITIEAYVPMMFTFFHFFVLVFGMDGKKVCLWYNSIEKMRGAKRTNERTNPMQTKFEKCAPSDLLAWPE